MNSGSWSAARAADGSIIAAKTRTMERCSGDMLTGQELVTN